MTGAVDFTFELANLQQIGANLAVEPDIVVPQAYPELCTARVLTMTRIHGGPVGHPGEPRGVRLDGRAVRPADQRRVPGDDLPGRDVPRRPAPRQLPRGRRGPPRGPRLRRRRLPDAEPPPRLPGAAAGHLRARRRRLHPRADGRHARVGRGGRGRRPGRRRGVDAALARRRGQRAGPRPRAGEPAGAHPRGPPDVPVGPADAAARAAAAPGPRAAAREPGPAGRHAPPVPDADAGRPLQAGRAAQAGPPDAAQLGAAARPAARRARRPRRPAAPRGRPGRRQGARPGRGHRQAHRRPARLRLDRRRLAAAVSRRTPPTVQDFSVPGVAVGVLAAYTWRRLQVRRVSHKPLRNRVVGFISRRF